MSRSAAEIVREYGPFPGVDHVHGVTYDGQHVWFAAGDTLNAFDPMTGDKLRMIDVAAPRLNQLRKLSRLGSHLVNHCPAPICKTANLQYRTAAHEIVDPAS